MQDERSNITKNHDNTTPKNGNLSSKSNVLHDRKVPVYDGVEKVEKVEKSCNLQSALIKLTDKRPGAWFAVL